jgi:alpha-glucosidase
VKLTLNLHDASGIQPWEDSYSKMAHAMNIDPATKKYVPADFTEKRFAANFVDLVQHPLEKQGVDFWWLDWQQEQKTAIANLSPTWWLNYVRFTDQQREGKRPLLFHRWGGLGNHRYEIGFSGETYSTWDSLAFQPWFTATAANVGYAYWSHDIGGHIPGAVDPEMYTRWVQFGVLSPILRTHPTKSADGERRIWAYPEPYSEIMRASYRWRYAMEPYLYTEGRRSYDTGVAFVHPLYYDWPEEDAAYTTKDEYVFGTSLIAAPIVAPMDSQSHLASRDVWVPPGEWIETATGARLTGPASMVRKFSLKQTPLYARVGAIVPQQPEMAYTGQRPVDPLIATVYPLSAAQQSSYTVYEDDGHAEDYQHGVCSWTTITAQQVDDDLMVTFHPVKGTFPGMLKERRLKVVLPDDWPPYAVTVNGEPLKTARDADSEGWRYEGNTLSTIVRTRSYSVTSAVTIVFHRQKGLLQERAMLNGFPGAIERLRASLSLLNSAWPTALPPNVLIEAAQTGNRIGYEPGTARVELKKFAGSYEQALSALTELRKAAALSDNELTTTLAVSTDKEKIGKSLPLFRTGITEAVALLEDARPVASSSDLTKTAIDKASAATALKTTAQGGTYR